MRTIRIALEKDLLRAADREVKRLRTNRSRLFRVALRELLKRSRLEEDEDREREAYVAMPEGNEMIALELLAPSAET